MSKLTKTEVDVCTNKTHGMISSYQELLHLRMKAKISADTIKIGKLQNATFIFSINTDRYVQTHQFYDDKNFLCSIFAANCTCRWSLTRVVRKSSLSGYIDAAVLMSSGQQKCAAWEPINQSENVISQSGQSGAFDLMESLGLKYVHIWSASFKQYLQVVWFYCRVE